MTDIRFYHLENEGLDGALPKLMERVISADLRAVIKVKDNDQCKQIDDLLWSYKDESFMAHDVEGCDHAADQPIFITTQETIPNKADCLVLLNAEVWQDFSPFQRVLYMFDGRQEEIVANARKDWKDFKSKGLEMSYWQQGQGGGWSQKA